MKNYYPYPFFPDDMPIDISHLFADEKPAGKHGFLHAEGRDFVFEDGTKAKFWGVNFNGAACFPSHEYSEKVARRLAKMGTNIVRFHQLDAEWHTPNIFSFTKGKRNVSGRLDPEAMERLDYLIWCLKEEGIYVYLDLLTYRKFRSDEGVENAHALKDAAKPACNYNRRLIELQKEFCRELWTHYNPYTKLTYADEPAIVLTEVVNESDLFSGFSTASIPEPYRTELVTRFGEWLAKKRLEGDAEAKAADINDKEFSDFREELQVGYYKELIECMRGVGVKIPIAGTNWNHRPGNHRAQLVCDFIDTHPYCYTFGEWKEFDKRCTTVPFSQKKPTYITRSGYASHKDMPTYISEWDMPCPIERRAESVVYSAAIGMFQGWSGFAVHTYSYSTRHSGVSILGSEVFASKIGGSPARQGVFATWNDPAKIGLFYYGALITRRGDVKEGKTLYRHVNNNYNEWDDEAINVNAIERFKFVEDIYGKTDLPLLPTEPITDYSLSDTGEIYRNWAKELGFIDTEMTKCVYGSLMKNGDIEIKGMKVRCDNEFAVIALSSITDKPIRESDHILLTTIGKAQNTNYKVDHGLLHDIGEAPVIIENIEAEIELDTSVSDLSVWAISAEGYYIGTVPTSYENGKLKIKLGDTSRSMYYLIVRS